MSIDEVCEKFSYEQIKVILDANRRMNAERAEIYGIGNAPYTAFVNADPKTSKPARKGIQKIMRKELAVGLTKNFYANGEVYHQI
jgi:hypothetical protein